MTVKSLIEHLQQLGEENMEREVIMFDGPSWYTPYKVELITKKSKLSEKFMGKVFID